MHQECVEPGPHFLQISRIRRPLIRAAGAIGVVAHRRGPRVEILGPVEALPHVGEAHQAAVLSHLHALAVAGGQLGGGPDQGRVDDAAQHQHGEREAQGGKELGFHGFTR